MRHAALALLLAAALAVEFAALFGSCAFHTDAWQPGHNPRDGVVVLTEPCDPPCCTEDFDAGVAADHTGCVLEPRAPRWPLVGEP